MEERTRNDETFSIADQTPPNNLNLRDRVGKALLSNNYAIIAAIIVVILFNNLNWFFPAFTDSAIWGIPLALLAIWLISWLKGESWPNLGFFRPESWSKIILQGAGIALVLQSIALLQIKLGGPQPDISSFDQIKNNPWMLIGYLIISWTTAGFGEEIIWRGFIMTQIARLFGEEKRGWIVGLLASAIIFGVIHAYQGVIGMVMTGFTGIIFGSIFLNSKRNLWASVFAHAFTDSLAFILIYNWDSVLKLLNLQ